MKARFAMSAAAAAAGSLLMASEWNDPVTHHKWEYKAGVILGVTLSATNYVSIPAKIGTAKITGIGEYVFQGCDELVGVTIPVGVTSIGEGAFSGCSGLVELELPDGMETIGNWAFEGCSGLSRVTIPDSVVSIGKESFSGCGSLMEFSVGDGNTRYRSSDGLLLSKDGRSLICGVNGDVVVTNSVESIETRAFSEFSALASVVIPDSVTSIGEEAFSGCWGLTNLTMGTSVAEIGSYAFSGCGSLSTVTIPGSVTSIVYGAFQDCESLTRAYVPEAFEDDDIRDLVFAGCDPGLQIIYYSGSIDNPESCTITFEADGGTCDTETLDRARGYPIGDLPVASRSGYGFVGWFDGDGVEVTSETLVEGDMALVAVWTASPFEMGGDAHWRPQPDGSWRSGKIIYDQETWIATNITGKGSLSFRWKVSSERDRDMLCFSIDGEEQPNGAVSGEMGGWAELSCEVPDGSHLFKWSYIKDSAGDSGLDCGWVKDVTWTPAPGSDGVEVDVGGKPVFVPQEWLDDHPSIVSEAGGDAAKALNAPAANGRLSNVECYVLGLDPTSETNDFKIVSFPMKSDGTPDWEHLEFEPEKARWNISGAEAALKGAEAPGGPWKNVKTASEPEKVAFRFFRIEVVLP